MERARLCSRAGCAQPATAQLAFQYAAREVWLIDLGEREPHLIDLCTMHADRLQAPRGWHGQDQRRAGPQAPPALAAS